MNEELKTAISEALKGLEGKFQTTEQVKSAIEKSLEGKFDNLASKEDITKAIEDFSKEATKDFKAMIEKSQQVSEEKTSIAKALVNFFSEKGIRGIDDVRKYLNQEFELKADNPLSNTSYTGNYNRTQAISTQERYPSERPLAFLDKGIKMGFVENGKNIIMWTTGAFTEVVGYAGELDDVTTGATEIAGSSATATDKTRKLAKIAARMIMSAEVFEDLGQFGQRAEMKLLQKVNLFLDQKVWEGAGNDATKPNEFYGAKLSTTAFDSGLVSKVKTPNESDLVDACATHAELLNFGTDTVWMSPTLANKLRRTKDTTGQYVINQLITGELVMGGHRVVKSTLFKNGATESMLVGNAGLIQMWMKRNVSTELVRNAKKDCYELYLYARAQVLVEDEDKKGLIYVADVAAALTAITQA